MIQIVASVAVLLALFGSPQHARGIVVTEDESASIRLAGSMTPACVLNGDFTVLAWIHPTLQQAGPRAVFGVDGAVSLTVDFGNGSPGSGFVRATISSGASSLQAQANGPLPHDEWSLIIAAFKRSTGTLSVYVHSAVGGTRSGASVGSAFINQTLGPVTGQITLGAPSDGSLPAMLGAYGLISIRDHTANALDAPALFATRRYLGPYDGRVRPAGGTLNGPTRCQWMLNHSMTTKPEDFGAGGSIQDRAAVVGQPVGSHNIHVFDRAMPVSTQPDEFRIVRPAAVIGAWHYASHRDVPYGGFFLTDAYSFSPSGPVSASSPKARQIATSPRQPLRVMVSANSRAVRNNDGSGLSPGNYAQGFWDLHRAMTSGVFFRPATTEDDRPWFGLDATQGAFTSGQVLEIGDFMGAHRDFGRFWTGATNAAAIGPGAGVFLLPGSQYCMLARPESGSLLTSDAEITCEAYVMRFPGAGVLKWREARGPAQGVVAQVFESQTMSLDTKAAEFAITSAGQANAGSVVLPGDWRAVVRPGDACTARGASAANGAITTIGSVTYSSDSDRTEILFTRGLATEPLVGDTLAFGPWSFTTIECAISAVSGPNTWRGIHLEAIGGHGVMVFGLGCLASQRNGLIWGVAGWGGNGYSPQIVQTLPGAMNAWMQQTRADVWIEVPAQQDSSTSSISTFSNLIRAALPAAEIVWAAEGPHPIHTFESFATYILDNAATAGVVGIVAVPDPRLGTGDEQYADGQRSDQSHISGRGNRVLARVWTDLIGQAALDPCPCNWNQDVGLDSQDYFDFVEGFFTGAADFNGMDGTDSQDLFDFLDCFFIGCS